MEDFFKKIEAEVVEVPEFVLASDYDNDISLYIDAEGDCNGMAYQDGYVLLNCSDGKIYFLRVVK